MSNTTAISKEQANVNVQVDSKSKLRNQIIFGVLAVGVAGLTFWGLQKIVQEAISNKEENKTLDEGSSATLAKQVKMAFDNDGWPGTDEVALRRVVSQIPSKEELEKVIRSYAKLYQRNLLEDMADELTTSEYNEMLYIISAKPLKTGGQVTPSYEGWAKRLRSATEQYNMGFWPGTDEDAINTVFNEIPNYSAYKQMESTYQRLYGVSLYDDLTGDMWYWEVDELIDKVKKKGN
jgi:hypothetical protein